jgi:uncharacterized membrane protein YgcG
MLSKLRAAEQPISDTAPSTPVTSRAPERFLLKMPQNLHAYDKQTCVSEGFGDQVSLCQPIDEREEHELINIMVDELNEKCGLELSHEFTLERPSLGSEPEREDLMNDVMERVIMTGGSHTSRMTDELDETCLQVMDISQRGWRLTEKAVEEKAAELKELVSEADEKRTTVVYQLFDNVCFQVKKEDGSKTLPEKGHDGRYHVEGKVEIASRDEVKKMVSTAMPLLRAGGQCRKIILTPTARYRDCPCCGIRGHCTNMKERNYKQWMDGRLTEIRGVVKDYVRMRNIKRATIISLDQLITPTAGLSEYLQQEELRGEDPVHFTPKGYSLAAAGLEALIYEKRGEEKDAEERADRQPAKKAKFDLSKKRPDWVKGSVSEAVRSSDGTRGNWRGNKQPGGTGQQIWRGGASGHGGRGSYADRGGSYGGRGSGHERGGGRGRAAPRGRGGDRGRGFWGRGRGRPW